MTNEDLIAAMLILSALALVFVLFLFRKKFFDQMQLAGEN